MNVQKIVKGYLEKNGFDGLYHDDCDAGCINDDIMGCGECYNDCMPGYYFTPHHLNDDYRIGPKP